MGWESFWGIEALDGSTERLQIKEDNLIPAREKKRKQPKTSNPWALRIEPEKIKSMSSFHTSPLENYLGLAANNLRLLTKSLYYLQISY